MLIRTRDNATLHLRVAFALLKQTQAMAAIIYLLRRLSLLAIGIARSHLGHQSFWFQLK